MNTNKTRNLDDISIACTEGISRRKNKLINVRITAPKEVFMLAEVLSSFGKIQSLEDFFIESSRKLLSDYLIKAEQIVSSAPPQQTNLKTN